MKNIYLSAALLALCFTSCKKETTVTTDTTVNDTIVKSEPAPEKPRDSIAEMEAWKKYMAPGEAHKMMAEENGKWTTEMTFWMEPDGKGEKYTATAEAKMILGGRYQEINFKGEMMGMPFEGRSTLSFNTTNNEYTSTWIDNMGTGMMIARGVYEDAAKVINFKGETIDPVDGKKKPFREVYNIVDANTRKTEMFDTKNGKEYKSMEILMKRK